MPVDTTFPKEGDALESADLNAKFTDIESAVNAVAADDISRGAFRRDHLPNSVDSVWKTAPTRGGLTATGPDNPDPEVYQNGLIVQYRSPVGPPQEDEYRAVWQQFSTAATTGLGGGGAPAPAPYGPGVGPGWRIPAYDGDISFAAERRLAAGWDPDGAANYGVDALLCNFGLNLVDNPSATIYNESMQGSDFFRNRDRVGTGTIWLAIGFEDDSGNRYIVERSIRAFPVEATIRGDVSIFTALRGNDVPQGRSVVAVFGAVLTQTPGTFGVIRPGRAITPPGPVQATFIDSPNSNVASEVLFDYYHFTYEPIRGLEF